MDEPSSSQESRNTHRSTNPRRKPAHESVSLKHPPRRSTSPVRPQLAHQLHSPRRRDGSSSSSMDVDAASAAASDVAEQQPSTCQKHSSGESTNPEKWFEDSNNHVKTNNPSFADNEPPFFLQHSSSENTPPEVLAQRAQEQQQAEAAASLELLNQDTGSSEGFRSVIDDLTIENKRLKRQLKRYGRLRDSYSHPEALFEVRMHGLPPEKKLELEELLRGFVSKIDATPRSSTNPSSGRKSSGRDGVPSSLRPDLTSSSTSRIGDSGYASWSASGQHTTGSLTGQGTSAHKAHESMKHDRRKDIQSYLSDIPAGLLPHNMGPTSSSSKKKIIVRRLEQLFAGRDPSGGHQQPIQQEKVAQSAARADRKATLAPGELFQEGAREARIMNRGRASAQKLSASRLAHLSHATAEMDLVTDQEESGRKTSEEDLLIEQRPTRPLDLDPYRAQIPSENMQYMRHLGFSPPDEDTMSAKEDGHGWIYLNVLYNMAQLHMASVPMEFVRKSINEQSTKLELSSDGRKVRWRGGRDLTRISSNNSPADGSQSRQTADGSKSSNALSEASGLSHVRKSPNQFAYSPLFHREESSSTSPGLDDEQYQFSNVPAASSIPASSGAAGTHSRMDDAPIIFYQNTAFYTDLSGDTGGVRRSKINAYHTISLDPVGTKNDAKLEAIRKLQYEKGPLSQPTTTLPTGLSRPAGTSSTGSLKVVPDTTGSVWSTDTSDPMDFEASGIGGVLPADNFSINVRSRQNMKSQQSGAETPGKARRKAYPTQIRRALQKSQLSKSSESSPAQASAKPIVQREIIASKTHELPASRLPDGTFFHNSSDDDDSSDEEMPDYDSDAESSSSDDVPMTAPQRMDWAALPDNEISEEEEDEDEDEKEDEEEDSDSDESFDLLATARAQDPEMIRMQEREFDGNVGDILADDIPAGSSAATAEGGSGFNSPTGYMLDSAAPGAINPLSTGRRRIPLKRARKSDDSEKMTGPRGPKSPKVEGGPSKERATK